MKSRTDVRATASSIDSLITDVSTADENVLKSLVRRLTGNSDLPVMLVGGKTVGTIQEIRYMFTKGDLARKMQDAGAVIDGVKKKKGRIVEA